MSASVLKTPLGMFMFEMASIPEIKKLSIHMGNLNFTIQKYSKKRVTTYIRNPSENIYPEINAALLPAAYLSEKGFFAVKERLSFSSSERD